MKKYKRTMKWEKICNILSDEPAYTVARDYLRQPQHKMLFRASEYVKTPNVIDSRRLLYERARWPSISYVWERF